MKTRTNKELLASHRWTHILWNKPNRIYLTKAQIRKEHARLVKIMLKRGFKHNSPLR